MQVREIMTSIPIAITAQDTVTYAAELMRSGHVGSLPVVNDLAHRKLVGIITDRDIAVRCVADSHAGPCTASSHMTPLPLHTVMPDDWIKVAADRMEAAQVRRLPVVDAEGVLVGIVAQADLAMKVGPEDPELVEEVLERVSQPPVGTP
jgi:CBS domain-containing protein